MAKMHRHIDRQDCQGLFISDATGVNGQAENTASSNFQDQPSPGSLVVLEETLLTHIRTERRRGL